MPPVMVTVPVARTSVNLSDIRLHRRRYQRSSAGRPAGQSERCARRYCCNKDFRTEADRVYRDVRVELEAEIFGKSFLAGSRIRECVPRTDTRSVIVVIYAASRIFDDDVERTVEFHALNDACHISSGHS